MGTGERIPFLYIWKPGLRTARGLSLYKKKMVISPFPITANYKESWTTVSVLLKNYDIYLGKTLTLPIVKKKNSIFYPNSDI